MSSSHYLEPLFAPKSVAVVGAGQRPGSLAAAVFRNLKEGGFKGTVHAVNPKYRELDGGPCYANLAPCPRRSIWRSWSRRPLRYPACWKMPPAPASSMHWC